MKRIDVLIAKCKKRGGDCPCTWRCEAISEICVKIDENKNIINGLHNENDTLTRIKDRLETPMATLKDDFKFDSTKGDPVMVFDDGCVFGYENANGEFVESDDWPFNQRYVYPDDCTRNGIRPEW